MTAGTRTFKVELDLSLYFVPPMDEHGNGIVVTREIELPFVPSPGLMVWSKSIDNCSQPAGFKLDNLVWDMDRQVFLANTSLTHQGVPIAIIPEEVRSWVDRGWKLGSYLDHYEEGDAMSAEYAESSEIEGIEEDEWEEMECWPRLRPQSRPKEFNRTFRVLIRTMVELYNNVPTAYAMDRTKRFFSDTEVRESDAPIVRKWRNARYDYEAMEWEEQRAWLARVVKKHPSLEDAIADS